MELNVRQWTYQLDRGHYIFNQPNTDWTFFPGVEKSMTALVKFSLLIAALSFKYFILPLIEPKKK
jgi:hypothetical protein